MTTGKLTPIALALVLGLGSTSLLAQDDKADTSKKPDKEQKWDVLNPPLEMTSVSINTSETTWSSLDISPDGKQFVFDMLGDLYVSDIKGGSAKPLTNDMAFNFHPAISPDGKRIAFISDRDGNTNVWTMQRDGSDLKQITKVKSDLVHSPKWSPDGQYIAVTIGKVSTRSIPAGEIWLFHHSGGTGLPVKERDNGKTEQQNQADPAFSPDGRYIYYTKDMSAGGYFEYNRDPLKSVFAIRRYDRQTGEDITLVSGVGGAVVPTPSPDGKQLAFVRRVRENTGLFVMDLASGRETLLTDKLERDMQEGFGSEGYFAYFDWTPDSKQILYWTGGTFHQIDMAGKEVAKVGVEVKVDKQIAKALRFPVDVAPDEFDVKMIRWAQKSPDGKTALFQALGKLYIKDIKTGKLKRLTSQDEHDEFYPRFSNDGKSIVYTTWNDDKLGEVRVISAKGGRSKVVSSQPGHYAEPSFSLDGSKVVYRKFTGGYLLSPEWSLEPGIYLADIKSGENRKLVNSGVAPHFAGDDSRVYFTEPSSTNTKLVSVDLNGKDRREHLDGGDQAVEFRLSHDRQWLAFVYQYNAYIAPYAETGKLLTVGPTMSSLPVTKVSSRAGEFLTWRADNQALSWHHGALLFERELKDAFAFINGAPETLPEPLSEGLDLSFKHKADKPGGMKALVGGRLVTMRDADNRQEVIENGVVLIENNRIKAIGKQGEVTIPRSAEVLDISGKTVIPGLIDAHAHGSQGSDEIIPRQNWRNFADVSFGVTTIHDPSNDTSEIFSAAELQKAGEIIAPRIYSTGTILYGANSPSYKAIFDDADSARFHLQRLKDVGAISVKSYNQPRRDVRQQIIAAGKELGMMVVPEGAGRFLYDLTMVVDGHTGLEHSIPLSHGYSDVTQLWAASQSGYTPTFVVTMGTIMGEEYWYDKTEVWKNERLLRYTPHYMLDSRAIRRPTAPDEQYHHFDVAAYAKKLRDNGVTVHIGAHGQRPGLGAHWELWHMQQGGFTPWEAIRGGTIDGAKHLGMDKDIGSLEVGKLADMVVIDGDVLNNLQRSEYVDYTVLNGRIYDVKTMNEVGSKTKRKAFFFERLNVQSMPEQTQQSLEAKAETLHWVHKH
ncbi:amidohydrolase family protein [Bowmanella denitrificans]|uniref:amidohydrolase family protein n=1 Tax=Bowmanella denitrificans TaxID=366582 RepID=UPI001FE4F693|nr:amidohydrolase family protein [Bowmanella denitrificans]